MGGPGAMILARAFATSSASAMGAAAPAIKASGGFAAVFGMSTVRVDVPMSQAIAVPAVTASAPTSAPKVETSVVEGINVASINIASPVSSVALILPGGSSAETSATAGAAKVMQKLAFKATSNRTTFRMTRELEKMGACAHAVASRESIGYSISATGIHLQEASEILLDSVLNPRFNHWEVVEAVQSVQAELAAQAKCPGMTWMTVCQEVANQVAFNGALGQPLMHDPSALAGFGKDTLREYASNLLKASNMVLAGAGVEHGALTSVAQPILSEVSEGRSPVALGASSYVGGSANVITTAPVAYVGVGFEVKGGMSDAKAPALATVCKALFEGSQSALPHGSSEPAGAMLSLYQNSGLIGAGAMGSAASSAAVVDSLCKRLEGFAKGPAEGQLAVAKAKAISELRRTMSSSQSALPFMAPFLMASGKFDSAAFASQLAAVSSADVAAFVSSGLKSSPVVVTLSPMGSIPRFDISKRF